MISSELQEESAFGQRSPKSLGHILVQVFKFSKSRLSFESKIHVRRLSVKATNWESVSKVWGVVLFCFF